MTPALPVSPVSDNDMVVAWSMMMKGERGLDVCRSQGSGLLSLSDGPHPARGLIRAPNFWSRVLVGNGKKKGEASLPPAQCLPQQARPDTEKSKGKTERKKERYETTRSRTKETICAPWDPSAPRCCVGALSVSNLEVDVLEAGGGLMMPASSDRQIGSVLSVMQGEGWMTDRRMIEGQKSSKVEELSQPGHQLRFCQVKVKKVQALGREEAINPWDHLVQLRRQVRGAITRQYLPQSAAKWPTAFRLNDSRPNSEMAIVAAVQALHMCFKN